MKVKITSDRLVGYKRGQKVSADRLHAAGVNVHQWLKCGLAVELVDPESVDTSTDEEAG